MIAVDIVRIMPCVSYRAACLALRKARNLMKEAITIWAITISARNIMKEAITI